METLDPLGDASPIEGEPEKLFTMDHLEPARPELTPDIAAIRSAGYELSFGGKGGGKMKLGPFSKIRQVASQCIGVEIFNNPNLWAELEEKRSYNGILRDAIFCVFLCSQPLSVSMKAVRIPSKVADAAMEWWGSHGGDIGSARHGELMGVFSSIVEDVFAVMAETVSDGAPDEGDGLGE